MDWMDPRQHQAGMTMEGDSGDDDGGAPQG